jgi:hypothetical protein
MSRAPPRLRHALWQVATSVSFEPGLLFWVGRLGELGAEETGVSGAVV